MNVDVHTWTPFFVDAIEFCKEQLRNPCSQEEWKVLLEEIKLRVQNDVLMMIDKWDHDFQIMQDQWIDPDLHGIHVGQVFIYTWNVLKENQAESLIDETLRDINHTCIQGITHRLLSLVLLFSKKID